MSEIHVKTASGRWILLATVLGSGMAGIDATVVNIALPTIGVLLAIRFTPGMDRLPWGAAVVGLVLQGVMALTWDRVGSATGYRIVMTRPTSDAFDGGPITCASFPTVDRWVPQ